MTGAQGKAQEIVASDNKHSNYVKKSRASIQK